MEPLICFEPTGLLVSGAIVLIVGVCIGILLWRAPKKKIVIAISLIGLIAAILGSSFLFQYFTLNRQHTSDIYFMPTQGQIYATIGAEETVQLFCFGDKDNPLLAEGTNTIPVQTDNKNINIMESTINVGSSYKGMTVFSIFFDVEAGQSGNQSFSQIILSDSNGNQKTFAIGKIDIEFLEPNEENAIYLQSCLGGANQGAPYSFSFKNSASKTCTITDIDFGSLTPYVQSVQVTVNDKVINTQQDMVIQSGELVSVEAKLKNTAEIDIYLASAKLRYLIQDDPKEYCYAFPYGTIGLPDSTESFQELAEKYLQN